MKKFVSLVLAAALCAASAVPALADSNSEKINEMLSVLKQRIGSTDEYDKFSGSVNAYGGETRYEFLWSKTDGDNRSRMNITMNSDGVVTSYYTYGGGGNGRDGKASINRPDVSEALDAAISGFKKLNPDISENVKITSDGEYRSLTGDDFGFVLQRTQNGIPVADDDGWISVSADAKRVVSFSLNYTTGLKFEDSSNLISKEDAQNSFNEKFPMKLRYTTEYKDDKKSATLIYSPDSEYNQYISATSGEVITREYRRHRFGGGDMKASESMAAMDMADNGFSEAEIKNLDTINGLIGLDKAEKIILTSKVINANSAYKLTEHALCRDWYDEDKYTYRLEFERTSGDEDYWLDAEVDAKSGDILSFYISENRGNEKAKLNVKQGYEKAYAALEVLAPSHFGENMDYLLDGDDKDSSGNYVFFRYVNGIEFADNSVRISVDMASGKIISYRIGYDDIEFPSADGVISAEDAGKRLFEQVGYDVWYIPTYEDDKPAQAPVVYDTDSYDLTLDAFSGELKYKRDSEKVGEYTDIENHYAKDAIEALAKFGIGFADSEFKPDINITQADFVTLLNAAFKDYGPIVIYKGISYNDIYDDAIEDGIVKEDEYSPDADVTRDLAAKMMVRALGFEEVATLDGIYVPIFADVSADSVGFTSILGAMGVIKGDENGNFNPSGTVTRADAAIMLYNYLSK